MRQDILRIAAAAGILIVLFSPVLAGASTSNKITICHSTGSTANPYVMITVSYNAVLGYSSINGGNHANDIIPAPSTGCPTAVGAPVINFTADATLVTSATQADTLTWSTLNIASCVASNDGGDPNFSGSVATSGSQITTPGAFVPSGSTITYTLTCTGLDSSIISSSIPITFVSGT